MKVTILILIAIFTDNQGNEHIYKVSDKEYTSVLTCHADKQRHKEMLNLNFACIEKGRLK